MPLYHCLFSFSQGINQTIKVPKGTIDMIKDWIEEVTLKLGLKITQYLDNPKYWECYEPDESISNEIASEYVEQHNSTVRQFYHDLQRWVKNPPEDYDELTPEIAQTFWHGLEMLRLPYHRWSKEYYTNEMEHLFDVMTRGESREVSWNTKKLTLKQAASVIHLFETYLDYHDVRLELPYKRDFLVDDNQYHWCPNHGAIYNDDVIEKGDKIYCLVSNCNGLSDYNS